MTRFFVTLVAAIAVQIPASAPSEAGPYQNRLSECIVASATDADRLTLIRWVVTAYLQNPAVGELAHVPPETANEVSEKMARLFEKLAFETCHGEMQDAFRFEGPGALETALTTFGSVAGRGLTGDPQVNSYMLDFVSHVDHTRLKALTGIAD